MGLSRQEYWSVCKYTMYIYIKCTIYTMYINYIHTYIYVYTNTYICVYILYIGVCVCVLVTQLCLNFWDLLGHSLPGSSVHGILQARILERVAFSFSRGSSQPRDQTWVSYITGSLYHVSHQGRPLYTNTRTHTHTHTHTHIKSPCCKLKTYTMLYVNYMSINAEKCLPT